MEPLTERSVMDLDHVLCLLAAQVVDLDLEAVRCAGFDWTVRLPSRFQVKHRDVLERVRTLGRTLGPFQDAARMMRAELLLALQATGDLPPAAGGGR